VTPGEVLGIVIEALDDAGIPHMVVGSAASSAHGAPRATQDIDLVIDPTTEALGQLDGTLTEREFYVASWRDALARREQFNVIHPVSGWKIDLIILKDRLFDRAEFERRQEGQVFGTKVWLATPEDTVLAKLEWAKTGGSDRQMRDVATVLEVRHDTIDNDYLDRWAPILGVEDLLAKARAAADD
jgi:hypothetical protein